MIRAVIILLLPLHISAWVQHHNLMRSPRLFSATAPEKTSESANIIEEIKGSFEVPVPIMETQVEDISIETRKEGTEEVSDSDSALLREVVASMATRVQVTGIQDKPTVAAAGVLGGILVLLVFGQVPACIWLMGTSVYADDALREEIVEVTSLQKTLPATSESFRQSGLLLFLILGIVIAGDQTMDTVRGFGMQLTSA